LFRLEGVAVSWIKSRSINVNPSPAPVINSHGDVPNILSSQYPKPAGTTALIAIVLTREAER